MLTAKQHELIRFIQTRLEETGISPSFEEMKEALDLKSKSGVHRLIGAMLELDHLTAPLCHEHRTGQQQQALVRMHRSIADHVQMQRAGGAVDQRHAVQQQARGQ